MSSENKILNLAFVSREAYNELDKYLSVEDFEGHSKILFSSIAEYYKRDKEAERCDERVILSQIGRTYPKHEETFRLLINGFEDLSVPNMLKEILEVKKSSVAHELSGSLITGRDVEAQELMVEWQNLCEGLLEDDTTQNVEVFQAEPVQNIIEAFKGENLISVYPKALNDRLDGGVPEQTHIVVYGVPEMGKSLVTINMAAGFCHDGHKTLFIENEDPAKQTLMRFINRMSGMSKYDVINNYEEAERLALEQGYDNLVFTSVAPGTIREIESLIQEHEPKCLVVNQIRHLSFRKVDGETQQLTAAGKAMRMLIKRYNLIGISVHQAADSATNKLVLEQGDVYMSNCLAKGTKVLMFNGSVREIQTISKGEWVMGMDSMPRKVLATGNGRAPMYKLTHKNGDSYVVNEDHIVVVKNKKEDGIIIDLPLRHLIDNPKALKNKYKGVYASIMYGEIDQPIAPYLFGLWLADGFSHTMSISSSDKYLVTFLQEEYADLGVRTRIVNGNSYVISFSARPKGYKNPLNTLLRELDVLHNKHIPKDYLIAAEWQRLRLLEGIIDGDGYLHRGKNSRRDSYRIALGHNKALAKDTKRLAQSLGFASSITHSPNGYLVYVAGDLPRLLPVMPRKQSCKTSAIDWLCSNIKIEKVEDNGEYFGITVDQDERYVLGNYIITHNTSLPGDADILLGIGANQQFKDENRRMLSLAKNKINANHEYFPVLFDEQLTKVSSI